ncbi:GDYXXLXY domain-containing protein [Paenibacillus xerothermodurans]|uniref:GDYXXLXY domain-containing protein n=1 Tax=Paenibacillus xerothermodurans TaxID=1977292 RepID=A0A2W1N530_PAEXE|nr:GDYXXLXY domain-containing protein [Paenibacillus xerothermodurans]PZE19487.1 hypothetical protein CBW46_018290 [Paenibacillus xerothermodurans]
MIKTAQGRSLRTTLLMPLVVLQVLFLAGMAGSYYAVGWYGTEIKLETVPVDPRDLLYGDYVTLRYKISELSPALWHGKGEAPKRGSAVYVALKPVDGLYEAAGVYEAAPRLEAGQVAVKGRVQAAWDGGIQVKYGLERYYVPEGTGVELERTAGDMIAVVKVAAWGQPRLIGLE